MGEIDLRKLRFETRAHSRNCVTLTPPQTFFEILLKNNWCLDELPVCFVKFCFWYLSWGQGCMGLGRCRYRYHGDQFLVLVTPVPWIYRSWYRYTHLPITIHPCPQESNLKPKLNKTTRKLVQARIVALTKSQRKLGAGVRITQFG